MRGALAALAVAAALAAPAHANLQTRGGVSDIAMDGTRVAVGVRASSALCDRLLVWNATAGGTTIVSAPESSATCPRERPNGGIGAVALAGTRAAWLVGFGGNTEFTTRLLTGTTTRPKHEQLVAKATTNPETENGAVLGHLVGHGALVAFNAWPERQGTPTGGRLGRLRGTANWTIARGVGALEVAATDGRRIAVHRQDETVALLSPTGALQRVLAPGAAVRGVALDGDTVAVQVAGNQVVLFSASTGVRGRTLRLAGGSAPGIDVLGERLVYRTYRAVHAVRMDTSLDAVVATTPRAVVDAEIERGGLVYAWNGFKSGFDRGHVQRLSLAAVDRELNPGR